MNSIDTQILDFSTDQLPERDRIPYWREHYGKIMLHVDLEPARDTAFNARMSSMTSQGLQLLKAQSSATRIARSGSLLSDGNDDIICVINLLGSAIVSSRGRQTILSPHQAIVLSGAEATSFHRPGLARSFTLRVPRAIMETLVPDIEDRFMQSIPENDEALKLLKSYAGWLLSFDTLAGSQLLNVSIHHVHDLLTLALGANTDAAETAKTRGLRAARLRSAKSYIVAHSDRVDISIASVAASLNVTPRYVQRLFEMVGTTFSEFLMGQRLAKAYRLLRDPKFTHAAISTIAYDVGFNDLSYFNRRFRRHYGITPRDVRGDKGSSHALLPCAASACS
jgi:AraC-like DNA-binding protein